MHNVLKEGEARAEKALFLYALFLFYWLYLFTFHFFTCYQNELKELFSRYLRFITARHLHYIIDITILFYSFLMIRNIFIIIMAHHHDTHVLIM